VISAKLSQTSPGEYLARQHAIPAALKALTALLMLGSIVSAHAAEAPDNVEAEIADAVQSCKDLEGTPNADAVLNVEDVNGDGGEDWIADYAKLKCEGGINQMCNVDGCTLQIFLWDGATAWTLAFEETVKSYQFGKSGGKRVLHAVMPGAACDKPSDQTCNVTFRLDQRAVVPVR
jgi:hypothetical protein